MDSASPAPRIAKICVIGDSGVGKTCLRSRYLNRSFQLGYKATIGADFLSRVVEFDVGTGSGPGGKKEKMSVSIWDTAGQERFRSLGTSFYRGSDAVIFVYSTTSSDSLHSLPSWFKEFRSRCPVPEAYRHAEGEAEEEEDFPWVCVGSKIDLTEQRQVKRDEVETLLEGLVPRIGGGSTEEVRGYSVEGGPAATATAQSTGPSPHSCQPMSKYPTASRTSIDLISPPDSQSASEPTRKLRKKKDGDTSSTASTLRTTNTQSIYHTPQSSFYSVGSHLPPNSSSTTPDHSRNPSSTYSAARSTNSSKASINSTSTLTAIDPNSNATDTDTYGPSSSDLPPSSSHSDSDYSENDLSPNSSAYYTHQYEEEVELERSRESTFAKSRGIDVWMSSSPPRAPESLREREKSRWRDPIEGLLGMGRGENGGDEAIGGADGREEEVEVERNGHGSGHTTSFKGDGIKHFETSSKTGEGIDEIFQYLFRRIRAKWAEEDERDERERERRERGTRGKIDLGVKIGKKTWKEACCT